MIHHFCCKQCWISVGSYPLYLILSCQPVHPRLAVVDKALEIVDRYQDRILELEQSALLQPKMKTVRECTFYLSGTVIWLAEMLTKVHVLGGDLTLHKRTLAPIKSLVYGLRRYDEDRYKALLGSTDSYADVNNVCGYMSHQARVYLVSPAPISNPLKIFVLKAKLSG